MSYRYRMPNNYIARLKRYNEQRRHQRKKIIRTKDAILLGTSIAIIAEKRGEPLPPPKDLENSKRTVQAGWAGTRTFDKFGIFISLKSANELNDYADRGLAVVLRELESGVEFHEIYLKWHKQ